MSSDTPVNFEQKLRIIEWQHLDLYKFYPMTLITSWTVRGLLYPLTVVKSRLQLQRHNTVYRGMRHAFVDIVRNEGITSLYRGFWITTPQLSASFVYSTTYEKLRNIIRINAKIDSAPLVSALAGGFASCVTQIIFVPTDVISQHMMIYNNAARFTGDVSTRNNIAVMDFLQKDKLENRLTLGLRVIRAVYQIDGIVGFYRGFHSSLLLYIPSSMVFWAAYYNALDFLKQVRTRLKDWFDNNNNFPQRRIEIRQSAQEERNHENLLVLQALAGAFGGVCCATVTNPLEVLRVRIQVQRTGYWETIKRLYIYEGSRVFTKGLAPRLISNCLNSCLSMIGYEGIKRLCVLPEYKDAIVW